MKSNLVNHSGIGDYLIMATLSHLVKVWICELSYLSTYFLTGMSA